MRTLFASGVLLMTIVLAVAFGVAAGYAVISALLRLLGWLHPVHPQKPTAAPALKISF